MQVTVRTGSKAGTALNVAGRAIVIGRDAKCDLVLDDDDKASRQHARLQGLPDGRLAVQDLGSANGTLVNGSPIQSTVLDRPASVQVGNTVLDFAPAPQPAQQAPAAPPQQPAPAWTPPQPGAPSAQPVGPRGERLSRVQRLTPSVVQRMTPSTIQRVIKRRSRRGMIIIGGVASVLIAGLVVALVIFSGDEPLKPAPDRGDFKVQVVNATDEEGKVLQSVLTESGVIEQVTDRLNREISLPKDVLVIMRPSTDPSEISPYWDPTKERIEVPYGWVDLIATVFAEDNPDITPEELRMRVANATAFILYHEVGHGLIHLLKLPTTGKEEDAVDGLAAAILIPSGDEAVKQVLDAAEALNLVGAKNPKNAETFADEHSLGEQRFYQLACWVFGSDPEKYSYIVTDGHLPESRAPRCPDEYKQNVTSWEKLLERYMKKDSKGSPES
jgi:hypothetical protein